jgi:hypothetical protein
VHRLRKGVHEQRRVLHGALPGTERRRDMVRSVRGRGWLLRKPIRTLLSRILVQCRYASMRECPRGLRLHPGSVPGR